MSLDWEGIESEIDIRASAMAPDRRKKVYPAAYSSRGWERTTKKDEIAPCLGCGDTPGIMYHLAAPGLPEKTCLCPDCFRIWKTHPMTKRRNQEEKKRIHDEQMARLAEKRPRNPTGWYLDLQEIIEEINDLTGKNYPTPRIDRLHEKDSLMILSKATAIRDRIVQIGNDLLCLTQSDGETEENHGE